jgi:hypothetical protein
MSDATVVCRFQLSEDGDRIVVRFRATALRDTPDGPPEGTSEDVLPGRREVTAEGNFEAELETDRFSKVLALISSNRGKVSNLQDVGVQLWTGLLSSDVASCLEEIRKHWNRENPFYQFRLTLPRSLEHYPWEALYDERHVGFLSRTSTCCVIHDPPEGIEWPEFTPHDGSPVKILVAIPQGSGLRTGPELRSMEAEVEAVAGGGIRLEALRGQVTGLRLSASLRDARRDVFHFMGHGGVDAEGRVQLRFSNEDASKEFHDLDIEVFSSAFQGRGVRLALLNACYGASTSAYSDTSLSGAGPYLLRIGVPAVIAMRNEIDDDDARLFAVEFYRELVKTGRVDKAVAWARQQMALTSGDRAQAFVTPVFYLAEGIAKLFRPWSPPLQPAVPARPAGIEIPRELVGAIRSRRCVPVLGPGLLRQPVARNAAAPPPTPPGPMELADLLKEQFGYPDDDDFRAADAADSLDLNLLQRVCQYSLADHDRASEVMQAITDAYRTQQPPAPLQLIAGWPLPGVVCTYFDGLMWHALSGRGTPPRVFNRVNESAENADHGPEDREVAQQRTVLVNLRGSIADAKSLVLTDQDNEELWESMKALAPAVSNLVYEAGRTLLFCGVSPRDLAVRSLMQRLMPKGRTRLNGPIYWVVPNSRAGDDAYWRDRYGVRWITQPYDQFIEALSAAISQPAGA